MELNSTPSAQRAKSVYGEPVAVPERDERGAVRHAAVQRERGRGGGAAARRTSEELAVRAGLRHKAGKRAHRGKKAPMGDSQPTIEEIPSRRNLLYCQGR